MLPDLRAFEGFLTSLSRVTGLAFEVWDRGHRVFSSGLPRGGRPEQGAIEELSRRVVGRGRFQSVRPAGAACLCGVPVRDGESVVGSVIAYGPAAPWRAVPPGRVRAAAGTCRRRDLEHLLRSVAHLIEDHGSARQEIDEMTRELSRSFEDLNLYSRIASQIKSLRFSHTVLQALMEEIMETMRADMAFAEFSGRKGQNVRIVSPDQRERIGDPDRMVEQLLASIPGDAPSLDDHYFIVNDSSENPVFRRLHPDRYRFLAVGVVHDEDRYGWLGILSFDMEEIFRQTELGLLGSMAEQVAAVIANTNLYQDLERFVVNMVRALVHAIEAKDVYTRGHSERVSRYCIQIATRLGLGEREREILHWASVLHDIGKIGIPERILNKPGRLTESEFAQIRSHPFKGFKILQPIEQLSESLPGILHHHERYDGLGYPDGLKGEAIPLAARIIAVADTYDAITSTRAYRPAKSARAALEIIAGAAGTQLDPAVAGAFVDLMRPEVDRDRGEMAA